MSQHTRSPISLSLLSSSSSVTLVVSPSSPDRLLLPNKKPILKLDLTPCSKWFCPTDVQNRRMSGKGFIEPHRNNLPRRLKRKPVQVTVPPVDVVDDDDDGAAIIDHRIEKTFSWETFLDLPATSEAAGPPRSSSTEEESCLKNGLLLSDGTLSSIQTQTDDGSLPSSSSPSIDITTNITEPTSSSSPSLRASPSSASSSALPQEFPTLPNSPTTTFLGFPTTAQTPVCLPTPPPPITPTKGHLQPTCATLPRRHRCLGLSAAREREQKIRRSIAEQQQTILTPGVQGQNVNDTSSGQRIGRARPVVGDEDLVANLESHNTRRKQSICAQELSKGITLGFLEEGDELDENIVRIKVYNDSTVPFDSPSPSPSSPTSSSLSEAHHHLLLFLPTNPLSYTDGTTSLTDHQIQRACTFIDEHISSSSSISSASINNNLTRPGGVRSSVLILAPRMRPEDAMSIGVSYLAGMEDMDKDEVMKGSDDHDDDDDYSTVHRLLMSFHDGPGSPIAENLSEAPPEEEELETSSVVFNSNAAGQQCGGVGSTGSMRGYILRPEWRGVLSFDGMQRLDGVWTPSTNGRG